MPNQALRGGLLSLGIAFLLLDLPSARSQEVPDLAAQEAQFEEFFAAALDLDGEDPLNLLMAWSTVLESAVVLDRVRQMATEGSDAPPRPPGHAEAVRERVLERWQEARPQSGGPSLIRTFGISDSERRRAEQLALLERYPDDPLVVLKSTDALRQAGQGSRATEVLEGFASRHPKRPLSYRLLVQHYGALENGTESARTLMRWAEAAPDDPQLVERWMRSDLPRREPEATTRLLEGFFADRPAGAEAYGPCLEVARSQDPGQREAGEACLARLAANPDLPVASSAAVELARLASSRGDAAGLQRVLATLEPEAGRRAALAAARELEAPDGCEERVELLRGAVVSIPAQGGGYPQIASALQACDQRRSARELFVELLRRAPEAEVPSVTSSWAAGSYGSSRDAFPAESVQVLEARLQAAPESLPLYRALDLVYLRFGMKDERFELLLGMGERFPGELEANQAVGLARGLAERASFDEAIEVLESFLEGRFEAEAADVLMELYARRDGPSGLAAVIDRLMASDDPLRRSWAHLQAAREALLRSELEKAEEHYWASLRQGRQPREVAEELLAVIGAHRGQEALEEAARALCQETHLGRELKDGAGCLPRLLVEVGDEERGQALLEQRIAELEAQEPPSSRELTAAAQEARLAGRPDLAERALRRALAADPLAENGWVSLGILLEREGDADGMAALVEEARQVLPAPPPDLLRAAGRTLAASGEARRGIELLQEARAALPEGASSGWIDHELREAYALLSREQAPLPRAGSSAPEATAGAAPALSESPSPPAGNLLAKAEALYSGSGGRYDRGEALALFEQAAASGDPAALFRLALLRQLTGSEEGRREAAELYDRSRVAVAGLARQGDGYGQYLAGTAALVGLGGEVDVRAARLLLEAAAAGGQSWAWHNLAWMKEAGRGFGPEEASSALGDYRRAARLGNVQCMYDVARLTLTCSASGAPCKEGLAWLETSAKAGFPRSQSMLGKLLYYGRGDCVAPEPERSLPWLEKALAAGQVGADYDLGLALLIGDAGVKDPARGLELLQASARRKDPLGIETLAFLHAT
ncbi:MAG: hypothetical protein KDD47_19310, partial [Acidobacteria bacterium]|nr:hypothetical protein [Acidobacteriota bacterium]